ncbi:ATP-binding protein [Thioalkalicoccus limnaeus]|uniref:ATP-binding protein n=1 Tax=Thioalkalicoccus limnaeus TaxID=120681 RepID=UPI003F74A9A1
MRAAVGHRQGGQRGQLPQQAAIEDIDYRAARGLDKTLMARLAAGQWLTEHLNVLITGPTGVGKSDLACALASQACCLGTPARYRRLPRLLNGAGIARADVGRQRGQVDHATHVAVVDPLPRGDLLQGLRLS